MHRDFPRTLTVICHGYPRQGSERTSPVNLALAQDESKRITSVREFLFPSDAPPDRCFHSHYRCAKDAACAFGAAYLHVEDPRLGEVNVGREGLWNVRGIDLDENTSFRRAPVKEIWRGRPYDFRPSNGESFLDAELRLHSLMGTLREECGGYNVVLFAPPMLMALLDRILLNRPIDEVVAMLQEEPLFHVGMYRRYGVRSTGGEARRVISLGMKK